MYRKHLPRRRMLSNTEAVWVGSEVERYRASDPAFTCCFAGKKTPPRLGGKPARDRYLVWTRFVGVGSGGIRTHNLLGDVRTSRLARLSVHTTEPLAQTNRWCVLCGDQRSIRFSRWSCDLR